MPITENNPETHTQPEVNEIEATSEKPLNQLVINIDTLLEKDPDNPYLLSERTIFFRYKAMLFSVIHDQQTERTYDNPEILMAMTGVELIDTIQDHMSKIRDVYLANFPEQIVTVPTEEGEPQEILKLEEGLPELRSLLLESIDANLASTITVNQKQAIEPAIRQKLISINPKVNSESNTE